MSEGASFQELGGGGDRKCPSSEPKAVVTIVSSNNSGLLKNLFLRTPRPAKTNPGTAGLLPGVTGTTQPWLWDSKTQKGRLLPGSRLSLRIEKTLSPTSQ